MGAATLGGAACHSSTADVIQRRSWSAPPCTMRIRPGERCGQARARRPCNTGQEHSASPAMLGGWRSPDQIRSSCVPAGFVTYQDSASHGFRGGMVRTARNRAATADSLRRVAAFSHETLAPR